ncbi:hypothetical protein LJY25_13575 [Hymenobacter sp. BT175]|nr:hypothetical protein [Hymenobacter translucens]
MPPFHNLLTGLLLAATALPLAAQTTTPIDRKALVERHKVVLTTTDTLSSLSVGNGAFAFTTDITGLQTFPTYYEKGVPLGTQSEWGWHSFPNTNNYLFDAALREYDLNGRKVSYAVQRKEPANKAAVDYLRENPHRLQLGNLGFQLLKKNGQPATIRDLRDIRQELNPWTGEIKSHFTLEGTAVDVLTVGHQQQDVVGVRVESKLIGTGRLKALLRFPWPTAGWSDMGTNYTHPEGHKSAIAQQKKTGALVMHQLDTTKYYVELSWQQSPALAAGQPHEFVLTPGKKDETLTFTFRFSPRPGSTMPTFAETLRNSQQQWPAFWKTGGAVDFSGSTDPRAKELERRVVLSQYLTKLQGAGAEPPQETGLVFNSWYGRPHLEMHWWHSAHFALWGRPALLEKSLGWYARPSVQAVARGIAKRQGYEGVRWQKMTDPWGQEGPSSVGAFLIWQQPHFIYFAEESYRAHPDVATLKLYQDRVHATAEFMASYPFFEKDKNRYILGKGVIPAQERFKAEETFNPTFELVYWNWALNTAQQWRVRQGLARNPKWDDVLQKLSKLPEANGVYLATESATDSYTNPEYKTDHPSVLGAFGIMPATGQVDPVTMRRTFDLVWKDWTWDHTWGWDFPMTSMTATRLGLPDKAVDALLMKVRTNTYLPSGHNYQEGRLPIYLPGNGGLLAAVALMCAGYDGCKEKNPGIPKTGWQVKWEGLKPMP